MWLMFKWSSQIIVRHPQQDTIHLLTSITSTTTSLIFRLRKKRLSIYNWNPGPRSGKEGFEKQIAGKWHVNTLQGAMEYVDHDFLTNRFHVTHHGRCRVLFNKDTFYHDVEVKSMYLHDTRRELPDKVMEGGQGWVLQEVLSRASFRRPPLNGQKTFAVLSLHISSIYDKKRCIAKKLFLTIRTILLAQHVDLVMGDFNGTAWRCNNRNNISAIEEAFADCASPAPPGLTPLWGPRSIPGCWADVCRFLEPPEPDRYWKVRLHGAFAIPYETPGLSPTDQNCHNETWLHLDFVDLREG